MWAGREVAAMCAMPRIFDGRVRLAKGDRAGIVTAVSPFPIRRWIERRPVLLVAGAAIFAAVFSLRHSSSDADGLALLSVVPIALVALELGLVAGIAAAALALGLVGVWALEDSADLAAFDVFMVAVAYLAVAMVAGRFGDRMRDAHARQQLLLESGLRLAHLERVDDLPAAVARHAQRLSSSRGVRVELTRGSGVESGVWEQGRVEERVPIEVRGIRYGTLAVSRSRPITAEDRATLTILALQAAVAAESRQLLDSERERAVIRLELQDARRHLAERGDQLRELIVRQEAERHHVADELHEQAAQTLAAVLLGLGALERELASELAAPRLGALRSDIGSTLRSLRSLAVSLRPPALELGLQAAVEQLADGARRGGSGEMWVALREADGVSEEVETMVYRVVEEALEALGAARSVSVGTQRDGSELVIDVRGARHAIAQARLAVLTARVELVGGTVAATDTELRAVIPLGGSREPDAPPAPVASPDRRHPRVTA
jgi:signal transduction histidine kinase